MRYVKRDLLQHFDLDFLTVPDFLHVRTVQEGRDGTGMKKLEPVKGKSLSDTLGWKRVGNLCLRRDCRVRGKCPILPSLWSDSSISIILEESWLWHVSNLGLLSEMSGSSALGYYHFLFIINLTHLTDSSLKEVEIAMSSLVSSS